MGKEKVLEVIVALLLSFYCCELSFMLCHCQLLTFCHHCWQNRWNGFIFRHNVLCHFKGVQIWILPLVFVSYLCSVFPWRFKIVFRDFRTAIPTSSLKVMRNIFHRRSSKKRYFKVLFKVVRPRAISYPVIYNGFNFLFAVAFQAKCVAGHDIWERR